MNKYTSLREARRSEAVTCDEAIYAVYGLPRSRWSLAMTGLWIFLAIWFASFPANAQSIIRDTEIEDYMKGWFEPVFNAAGMSGEQVNVIIVQDPSVNAFVTGGANIFLYTGLIQKTENPGELIGVVAHELGHIAGGHLIRGREAMENASYEAILSTILGGVAAVASGNAGAAAVIGQGGASMAQRRMLSTARTYESSADQAALRYMNGAGIDPTGLKTFMQKLEDEELVPTSQQSEYVRTHPLTRNRIDAISTGVSNSTVRGKAFPAVWDEQHARMKAKLLGFINAGQVGWTYNDLDKSIPAQYAYAIAAYRQNKVKEALARIDKLIAAEPDNAYFHELKGQMLVDFGRVAEGIPHHEKALSLRPDAALIRIELAHALLETAGSDKKKLQRVVDHLRRAQRDEPRSTQVHRMMATAQGRMGNEAAARLHLAEEALLQGRRDYAKSHADYAAANLPQGSADRLRAQDILSFIALGKK